MLGVVSLEALTGTGVEAGGKVQAFHCLSHRPPPFWGVGSLPLACHWSWPPGGARVTQFLDKECVRVGGGEWGGVGGCVGGRDARVWRKAWGRQMP